MAEGVPLQGLDEAVGSVLGDQAAAIRNNLAISLPGNPDQAAQYQHLAKFVGVPVESVQAFPDEVKTQVSLQRFDADGAVRDYPHLARFLTDLPSVQKAHDDLPQLAAVEKAAQPRPPAPPPPAVAAQSTDFESRVTRGLLGLSKWLSKDVPAMPKAALQGLGGSFNTLAQGVNTVLGAFPAAYDMAAGGTAASDWWFSHMVDRVIADADAFRPGDSFSEKAAHSVGSLVGMLSQITLSGTGAPGLAPAVPAEVSAGKILSSATEHAVKSMALPAIDDAVNTGRRVYLATGGDALAASNAATAQWAATTGMGLVPLSAAGRTGTRLATGAVSGMVAGEASREGMNAVLPEQMAAPFDWESLFLSGVTGALMGGVMGPRAAPDFNAAIRKTYTDAAQADKAMQDAAQLGTLSQIASASRLRERDPEAFRQFVENVTEDGNLKSVYVDAAKLGEVLNQTGIRLEDFAAQLPNVARQMHEAAQTEGMVEIPVADYATKIAGGPLDSVLLPELRTAPDGKTYSEAQAFYQTQVDTLKAQAEKIISDRAVNEAAQAQNDALRARILETISAGSRFRPEVNDTYATLQTAYTLQRAALVGMDPIAFHEQYGVKVVSDQLETDAFRQSTTDPYEKRAQNLQRAFEKMGLVTRRESSKISNSEYVYVESPDYTASIGESGKVFKIRVSDHALPPHYEQPNFDVQASDAVDHQNISGTWLDALNWVSERTGVEPAGPVKRLAQRRAKELGDRRIRETSERERIKSEHQKFLSDLAGVKSRLLDWASGLPEDSVPFVSNKGNLSVRLSDGTTATFGRKPYGMSNAVGRIEDIFRYAEEKIAPPSASSADQAGTPRDGMQERQNLRADESGASAEPAHALGDGGSGETISHGPVGFRQGGLGAYSPETNTIALLKGANLSTFLHESGHYFLNTDAKLAALPEAPETLRRDMNTVLDWLGVKGSQDSTAIDQWHRMSLDEQRQYHEKYARGFEAYLFEGKAPNLEMQGVFSRLRSWMLAVYKSLTALNVQLTPEVRGVFDRMLSSEQAIRDAEAARGMLPLFTAPGDAMTAEAFARYQQLGAEATVSALDELQSRSLRDMKWLSNAKAGALRDLQAQANAARAAVREQVSREVSQQPVYRAEAFLRRGEVIGDDGAVARDEGLHKLDIDRVNEMAQTVVGIDPEGVKALGTGKHGMLGKIGLDPDFAAERLGFINGEDLVRSLLAMEKRADVVNRMTDQRMLEQHGELVGPAALERAAEAAIHNEARARFIATELSALAKATGPAKRLADAAREAANAAISAKRVMDIRPLQYTVAEGRSGKAAMDALKRGDVAGAAQHKRAQLLNNALARSAQSALEDVRKGVDYLSRFGREGIRGKVDHDYMAQIDAILDRYDIRRSVTNKEVSRRQSLAEWVAQQEERGLSPSVPDYLLQESARTHYKAMSVEEFSGLVDTVRQIEHLGRLKNKLLVARETRTYQAARDEIVDSIRDHSVGRTADTRTPVSVSGRVMQGIKGFFAAHIKAATIARILDGGKDGGPMWEHFIRTANDRADTETVMRHEATEKLTAILKPVMALGKMEGKGQLFDSIGMALNREQRIAIALNVGNEGNLQRLLGGEGWTRAQIEPVLQSLTAAEWRAVQSVWDLFESYRPLIAAKELRVYGIEPKWVEPTPFTVASKDGQPVSLRGGYYPIKYDTSASERAERNADAETAKDQMRAGYTSATTRRSFTKARVDEVRDRPLLYSLSGLYGGLNEVIHDLAWHEWLIDTNRFMRSQSIDNAIRSAYGPEYKRELKNWVADIARGDAPATHAMERAVGVLRHGISVAGLGFNVMSAAIQPLGYTQSIVRIGPKYAAVGLGKMLSSPLSLSREINEKSDFMRERGRTRFRELNELRNQVQGKTAIKQAIEQHAYSLMLIMQRAVDLPTWWGGYEKAIAQGNAEARAIDLADQAVKDSQGSGLHMDLSGVERGGPFVKMFTTFYSFMNTAFNLGVERTMASRTPSQRARLAADYLLLYVLPPALGLALKNALTPGESGLDDEEKLAKRLAKEQLSFALGLMVGVREFSSAADIVSGKPNDYAGPGGLRVVGDAIKTAQQAHQGEFDDAFRKALINLAGDMFALPSAQINRSITGIEALQEGKTDNPAAVVFGFQSPH